MMPVPQSEAAGIGPPKLHRLFRFYDPEAVAVLIILLGLFQLLLGIPIYYMSITVHMLYMCPVCVGAVFVIGGSFAIACERSPSRQQLKNCFYSGICGLLVGLCAIVVYGYAVNDINHLPSCEEFNTFGPFSSCPQDIFVDYFKALAALLFVYDMAALALQCFLSFSAMKGLKSN